MMRNNQDEWEVEDIVLDASQDSANSKLFAEETEEDKLNSSSKKSRRSKSVLLQRSEASLNVSEYNLTEIGKEKIKLNELVKTSLKTPGQATQKNLQKVKKLKRLKVPLSKTHQEKVKRAVAYDKVCKEVAKWDSLVQSNRTADQLIFPLKKPDLQIEKMESVVENFVSKHPVKIAVTALLNQSDNKLDAEKPFTAIEEKALQAMSAAEAKKRHAELMKHRALISYKEAKARRQNKIKSKRYHRLLKREKLKKVLKEFEDLQKKDADMALEKIAELDKLRILERMTLKHRNTGKWAKQQKIRAKYNPDIQSILKEDLAIGRQLREKVDIAENVLSKLDSMHHNLSAEDAGLIEVIPAKINKTSAISNENLLSDTSDKEENLNEIDKNDLKLSKAKISSDVQKKDAVPEMRDFLSKEDQILESSAPGGFSLGDECVDELMEDVIPMSEAFGSDDCIAEFREEKISAEKNNKVEGINLYLPGWGSWGGPNIKPSKRKMRRFFIQPPPSPPKKNTLGNVIINEDKDKKASLHQVNSVPFPFSSVHQFESYIRQPIGHTWNPQSSFQNLIAPKVITKMGKIIEPIDSDDLVLKSNNTSSKKNPGKKKKRKDFEEVKAF